MKIVAELIVFLAREEREAPAGEKGSPTLCIVRSVEERWQLTLENQAEMVTQEAKNILKRRKQKMRIIPSFGYTLCTTTRGGWTSTTACR